MNRPTVPEVLPLARAYVAKSKNIMGGHLHIVLEDYNIADGHIEWCRDEARKDGDDAGVELAELLLKMSRTQRLKIAKKCWEGSTP